MYAKVFSSLWNGSLRGQPEAQLVFIYMLAHCDEEGVVDIIVDKITDDTGLGADAVKSALETLEGPDPCSRQPGEDGRRLLPLYPHGAWGWRIVNHDHYRQLRNEEERRRQNRESQARFKASHSAAVSNGKHDSADSAHTEADTDTDKSKPLVTAVTVGGAILAREGLRAEVAKSKAICAKAGDLHAKARALRREQEEAFDAYFWPPYPRKVAKDAALAMFRKRCLTDDDLTAILKGLEWYKQGEWDDRPKGKIPHASTWLNERRWTDAMQEA